MADAASNRKAPRRAGLRFPWLVPTIRLEFELGLERTRVTARLDVERNPVAAVSTIRLNGDGLELVSLTCDGGEPEGRMMDGDDLLVTLNGDRHVLEIVTEIDPSANSQLMGLYASNGMLCTQCEAEGFRRITFFPDRPDVLSTYTVRMSGAKAQFPVCSWQSRGNRVDTGADGEHHWAEWHDPWPKPSYLFALVAGDLVARSDSLSPPWAGATSN